MIAAGALLAAAGLARLPPGVTRRGRRQGGIPLSRHAPAPPDRENLVPAPEERGDQRGARGVTGEVAGSYTEATCWPTRRAKVRRGVRQDRIAARRSGRADGHLLVPGPAARHGDRDGAKRLQCGRLDADLPYMLTALVVVIAVATALA